MLDQKTQQDILTESESIPDLTENMGNFINREIIMSRNPNYGGCLNEILGPQGTGKTSLMLSYACSIMEQNPDEIIIWRDSYQSPCQFNRLKKWEIFVEDGVNLIFRDIVKDKNLDLPVKVFKDFKELEKMVRPQQLNVVYVKSEIVGFIRLINHFRRCKGWQSIFLDEYEDIAPMNMSGVEWRLIGLLGQNAKNIRKGLVSLFCNTQDKTDVDFRIRKKFMVYTYLPGCIVDSVSPIYQEAVNAIKRGSAFISWGGKFGKIRFPGFPPKNPIFEAVDLNHVDMLDVYIDQLDEQKQ